MSTILLRDDVRRRIEEAAAEYGKELEELVEEALEEYLWELDSIESYYEVHNYEYEYEYEYDVGRVEPPRELGEIRIPYSLGERLKALAAHRERPVAVLLLMAVFEYLEDLEDIHAVEEARAAVARGEDELLDWEAVEAELDE